MMFSRFLYSSSVGGFVVFSVVSSCLMKLLWVVMFFRLLLSGSDLFVMWLQG